MVSLRPPGLGPIIGHTTDTTCRVWIRAGDPADQRALLDSERRTVGVIGIMTTKGKKPVIGDAWYFRLQREFDRTGTFVLGNDVQLGFYPSDYEDQGKQFPAKPPKEAVPTALKPDTGYTVRAATLTIDDPMPNEAVLHDWQLRDRLPSIDVIKNELLDLDPEDCEATFHTFPGANKPADTMSFLLGSCRYPGLLWKIKEADRIFGPMQAHFDADNKFGEAARFTMMCGDQIYADMLNRAVPLMRADTYGEFQERYLTAFGAPNLRSLLRKSTTYMILDDHEIEDNWTQDRISDPGKHQVFNFAISAYMSYQWSHSPRTWGRLLYYAFDCAGYPFFVLDTRTQRMKNDTDPDADKGLEDNHLLGYPNIDPDHPGQLQRLLDWLKQQQDTRRNVPKFIVTSSVFVPNAVEERFDDENPQLSKLLYRANKKNRDASDSWPAFPKTRLALLEHIVKNEIQNVVFLAGDIHCSNLAEIEFEQTADEKALSLKAFSVTSSAFYWPFPFADGDPNGYVHDSRDKNTDQWDPLPLLNNAVQMHYKSYGFTQDDNFVRLDIDKAKHTLTVRMFNNKGDMVEVGDDGAKRPLRNVLQLAAW